MKLRLFRGDFGGAKIFLEILIEILFEMPPDLHVEIRFEIYPNNGIYARRIGVCATHCDSIIHAKPNPQPPCQAKAWSHRYSYWSGLLLG